MPAGATRLLRLCEALDRRLAQGEQVLAGALVAALTAIMLAQVVLRYFFHAPLFWAEEVCAQLLVFATLLGLSLLARARQWISVDWLARALPAAARRWLDTLQGVAMLGLLAWLAWLGWDWIARPEVRAELGATIRLPRWYSFSVFPLAFTLMAWHQCVLTLRQLVATPR